MTRAPDRASERGREFDRFIGRLLIAVTYIAVGLLSVGVVLLLAAGISPLAGGPPLDPSQGPGGPRLARPCRVPVAGDPRGHRDADQPGHRGGDRVRAPGRSVDGRRRPRDPRGDRPRDRVRDRRLSSARGRNRPDSGRALAESHRISDPRRSRRSAAGRHATVGHAFAGCARSQRACGSEAVPGSRAPRPAELCRRSPRPAQRWL